MVMPGDDLVIRPRMTSTRAITIKADPEDVWPWVIQIGQGRGGFYSHDWLENVLRLDIHSANKILPQFQDLQEGDVVKLHPQGGLKVAKIIEGNAVVLYADSKFLLGEAQDEDPGSSSVGIPYFEASWAFFLKQQSPGVTRLFSRARYDYEPCVAASLMMAIAEICSFIMDHKMLNGIRQRVQHAHYEHS